MKVKRFTAANMQVGLKTIGETLGPEAVILSNRRLRDGLEIVAGVDEAEYERFLQEQEELSPESDIIKANPKPNAPLDKETMQQLFSVMSDKNKAAFGQAPSESSGPEQRAEKPATVRSKPSTVRVPAVEDLPDRAYPEPAANRHSQAIDLLRQEIDVLKDLLKEQTEQLKEPSPRVDMSVQYERLESRLQALGFTGGFIRKLLSNYDREDSLDQNWRQLMNRLATALPVPMFKPLDNGGAYVLTGPTGAGKTTTIAKLAAHAVKERGARSVAVISMDWFQVGGQEILKSVMDILGVEFFALTEQDSLAETLDKLSQRHLVLIDTSGSAEALQHWNRLMRTPALANRVQTLLVLPATMMPSAVNQFVEQMAQPAIHGTILSKVDESACFGGALEPVLRHRWPLWYVTTGQNIPQDIELADGRHLTKRLVRGLKSDTRQYADAS